MTTAGDKTAEQLAELDRLEGILRERARGRGDELELVGVEYKELTELAVLVKPVSAGQVEHALRCMAKTVNGADPLRRASIRAAAVKILAGLEVASPASLVDAALETAHAENNKSVSEDAAAWQGTVYGRELLTKIQDGIARFVVLSNAQRIVVAVWAIATHMVDFVDIVPYLRICGPTKELGKTVLLDVLARIVRKALVCGGLSTSAMFRSMADEYPTLLLDELDKLLDPKHPDLEMIQVFTTGFRRGGASNVRRTSKDSKGQFFVEEFPVFGFKAFTSIRSLPDEIASRSIPVLMRKKLQSEHVERAREKRLDTLAELGAQAAAWVSQNSEALEGLCERGFDDARLGARQADIAEVLYAVAQQIGVLQEFGDALNAVFSTVPSQDDDLGTLALRDAVVVLHACGGQLPQKEVAARMRALEDTPWPHLNKGTGLTDRALMGMLEKFGLPPRDKRVFRHEGRPVRGVKLEWLEDSWARWVGGTHLSPPLGNGNTVTTVTEPPNPLKTEIDIALPKTLQNVLLPPAVDNPSSKQESRFRTLILSMPDEPVEVPFAEVRAHILALNSKYA